jgi:MFS family permease
LTEERPGPRWSRSITALILCVFCSSSASIICVTALGLQVFDLTRREFDLGLLGLAEFSPSLLLMLATGSVADRFDRRRVSSSAAMVEALAGAGLALYAASRPSAVWPIFALVLVFGTGRAFLAPANRALPADIVPSAHLPWLTSRRAVTWQTSVIVAPVVAGFLYAVDPAAPYVAMSLLLVAAAISMSFVSVPIRDVVPTAGEEPPSGGLHQALAGLRFIRRSPILLGAISLDLFAVLFGGAVALLPAIAVERLHVGSVGLGWLRGAGGIGAAIVTLLIARRPITRRVGVVLLVSVAIFGGATIVLGSTTIYALAFIAMAVLSGADSVSVFIRSTLVPLATPSDKRGRVIAVESVFIGASNELGAFESGVVGQLIGSAGAVITGGAATLLVAGTYWVAFPALRNVDRFPEPAER